MTRKQRVARGRRFRQAREKAGLSSSELAKRMGYKDPSAVRHCERGATVPRDLARFCRVTGADLNQLLATG
jgi:ribosome-binding protein aMBF1 (putative translation factor)